MPSSRPRQAGAGRPQSSGRPSPTADLDSESKSFPVVGIGASAGGLDACRKLLGKLPDKTGMAFILVQHLDPTHESMMVDLLASHTKLVVRQAADGTPIERDHLYVIPPGTYLSVADGALHLSSPQARHGARMPFDFLLHSLAAAYGANAICIVLSGTGADGSLGLKAINEKHGLVIAQDPDEAGYNGMPRNAIVTGAVDLVLPVARIPEALVTYVRRMALAQAQSGLRPPDVPHEWLPEIIDLLRTKTVHDFRLYKPGTLQRRIERRMAMASIETDDVNRYIDVLRTDANELDLLAKDLLINVTSFFRDTKVFDLLAETIIPDLVAAQSPDNPIRIWIAGCSTGEETYSLAMLFRERISAVKRNVKLQVFASDIDPDAVAKAREGTYPATIEADVSPERLARFFTKEEHGYRISPDLRASVVFTVQDVLADPPFSRLDLVSCRNLLIYLRPEAQAKVISLFHFALRDGGLLLLGSSETVGSAEGRFEEISRSERLYRHIGHGRSSAPSFAMTVIDGIRPLARQDADRAGARQGSLADLCRRLVTEAYAPAAVLVNRKYECLYTMGPTDTYLQVAPGLPVNDLLAMAREGVRNKLRAAIQQALQASARVVVPGGRVKHDGGTKSFRVAVQPIASDGEELLFICFIDEPKQERARGPSTVSEDLPRIAELERELDATRLELQGAIRNLEIAGEEQKTVNEEALSVNEEFQSTNEELMTSKEELQSLNEELTALNSQLQETLDRQRTTSNDLQNVLFSTDVATIFLDINLNIRFFTPATKSLFRVIPGDIGRPLADLSSLAADDALLSDARTVLRTLVPIEREIEAQSGAWYVRRVLPYRTQANGVEGVVITFVDSTERRRISEKLEAAERLAQQANVAKSRFLSAASHDLRQPLQTLALLHGLLAKAVEGERAQRLVSRLDDTLSAMSGMLNTLLDINQIEAGTVHAQPVDFPINDLLGRLKDEFTYHAQSQRLSFRTIPCSLTIRSDPRLLEQMLRNLLSNALKYTETGKILLGCRRRAGMVNIEVWDTGVGIPTGELDAIFDEYHQIDNAARERSRGLGLGLSIVQRLGILLGHKVGVRSLLGKGSGFSVEVKQTPRSAVQPADRPRADANGSTVGVARRNGSILVVEDDPELRDLLKRMLEGEGHRVASAASGIEALNMVAEGKARPDLVLADYNLPQDMNGLQVTVKLRERMRRPIPVIILTGDISTDTLRSIAAHDCAQLNKPVKTAELIETIQRLLPPPPSFSLPARKPPALGTDAPIIFVVDDDRHIREAIRSVLEDDGLTVEDYDSCAAFLDAYKPGGEACLLIDAYLPGMTGLELLQQLRRDGHRLPAIMITGSSDVPMAVEAMKAGASDFIEKPVGGAELLASVQRALDQSRDSTKRAAWQETAASQVAGLTERQRQIMDMVLAGHPSKNIAADLGVSQRTVENHRAAIMKKTGTKSLPALARLALAAASTGATPPPAQHEDQSGTSRRVATK